MKKYNNELKENIKNETTKELYKRLKRLIAYDNSLKEIIVELSNRDKEFQKLRKFLVDLNLWSK